MQASDSQKRPPVIVVLGHVDHGKTTLLDYIRKTNTAAKEAGGITQSIGAYSITHNDQPMTFIDTPGHEAFSKMRARGVNVADIAILVVAIDDGVQAQTKEAISIIQEANVPYVVALTKTDKAGVDIDKVKNELTSAGVLLEGYGGSVSFQPISAKTGEGVSDLLDLLLLAAEVADLTAHREVLATGTVLESLRDKRRGVLASVLVRDGVLKQGAYVRAGNAVGKVKGLENVAGERIAEAGPSEPVLVFGFETVPNVGDPFESGENAFTATAPAAKTPEPQKRAELPSPNDVERVTLKIMCKADVSGSLEALAQIIEALPKPDAVEVQIMDQSLGDVTDGDVKFAASYGAIIVGFNTKIVKQAQTLAEAQRVKIITSAVVYDLVKAIEAELTRLDKRVIKGDLEILAVFGKKGSAQIVGGKVVLGAIENHATIGIERKENVLGVGKIVNLQTGKKDVSSLASGLEGGLLIDSDVVIKVGDHIIVR